MQTLDKKDLATFAMAQPDYRVHLQEHWQDAKRKWLLMIESPSTGQLFTIVTALGQTRLFTNPETAIDFIKETCPNNPDCSITLKYGTAPS